MHGLRRNIGRLTGKAGRGRGKQGNTGQAKGRQGKVEGGKGRQGEAGRGRISM